MPEVDWHAANTLANWLADWQLWADRRAAFACGRAWMNRARRRTFV